MTEEIYVRFSHFNFNADQWREAAERYIELCHRIREVGEFDDAIDHDALAENFVTCHVCEELRSLEADQEEFAKEFARVWAEKALTLTEKSR